jgi:dihydrofolate reductase
MRLSLIVAMTPDRVIGVNNRLPWHLPNDLKRVKALTTGHHIILGRKNYESIGKALPNRVNVVLTRNPAYSAPDCVIARSLNEALDLSKDDPEVFIFGGATLYQEALPRADRIYLTWVHADVEGDTFFPLIDLSRWHEVERQTFSADTKHVYPYTFVTLDRSAP